MTLQEAYTYLFADSFMAMLFLPLRNNFVFEVMKIFGTFNPVLMALVVAVGSGAASIFNWLLGKVIKKALQFEPEEEKAVKLVKFLQDYQMFIVVLSAIPYVGSVIITAYGTIDGKLKIILPVVVISHFIFFSVVYRFF